MPAFLICRIAEAAQDDAVFYSIKQKIDAIRHARSLGPWYLKHQSLGPIVPSNLRESRPTVRQHAVFMSHWPQQAYSCISHPMKDPGGIVNVIASETMAGSNNGQDDRMADVPSIEYPPGSNPSDMISFTGAGMRTDKLGAYWLEQQHMSTNSNIQSMTPATTISELRRKFCTILPEYASAPVVSFSAQDFDSFAFTTFKLNIPCLDRAPVTQIISGFTWQLNSLIISFGSVKTILRQALQEHGQSVLVYITTAPEFVANDDNIHGDETSQQSSLSSTRLAAIATDYRILMSLFERFELPPAMSVCGHTDNSAQPIQEVRAICQILR